MFALVRIGAYLLSGLSIWSFFQGGAEGNNSFSLQRHLALDPAHGMIFGVCAGVSNFISVDVTLIRFIWFVTIL